MPQASMKVFRNVSIYDLMTALGVKDPADWDENPQLLEYIDENSRAFIREWAEQTARDEELDENDIVEAISDSVNSATQENASRSMFKQVLHAMDTALSNALERANIPNDILVNEKKGTFTIKIDRAAIRKAWAEETSGMGYVAWDPSLGAKDIKDAKMLVNILAHHDEVYGQGSMSDDFNAAFENFEPDTGKYHQIVAVAEKALKNAQKSRRK